MLSIIALAELAVVGGVVSVEDATGSVCFDMEAGVNADDESTGDDEVFEDTTCQICAAYFTAEGELLNLGCADGLTNKAVLDCISMPDYDEETRFRTDLDVVVGTDCHDGLWFDRLVATERIRPGSWHYTEATESPIGPNGGPSVPDVLPLSLLTDYIQRVWGSNYGDISGWCLSLDYQSDAGIFGADVYGGECFSAIKFGNHGQTHGWQEPHRRLSAGLSLEERLKHAVADMNNWKELSSPADRASASDMSDSSASRQRAGKINKRQG